MQEINTVDLLDLNGCMVKDEYGTVVAILQECGDKIRVEKTPACSLGTYLYIISYLNEMGFEAE